MSTLIVDYGMGNLRSVQKAFEHLGVPAIISSDPRTIAHAEQIVLPGVGAFRDAIEALRQHDLINVLRDHIAADRPFLGICLGLQLLFDRSLEDGEHEGLGIIPGTVQRFQLPPDYKIPHMGWNQVDLCPSPIATAVDQKGHPTVGLTPVQALFAGLDVSGIVPEPAAASGDSPATPGPGHQDVSTQPALKPWFYFVHSYHCVPNDQTWVAATTNYGGPFVSVVGRGNVMATQFHPEKSQASGLRLLKNFVTLSSHPVDAPTA